MYADFQDAHERHWHDAEHLHAQNRLANADHLYGMAAECGLKRLMQAMGMSYDPTRDRPTHKLDRVHANGIWARFETYRCGHHGGAAYALPSLNPFSDWDVSQRYANQQHFDEARVDPHKEGAAAVRRLVRMAQFEGII